MARNSISNHIFGSLQSYNEKLLRNLTRFNIVSLAKMSFSSVCTKTISNKTLQFILISTHGEPLQTVVITYVVAATSSHSFSQINFFLSLKDIQTQKIKKLKQLTEKLRNVNISVVKAENSLRNLRIQLLIFK